MLVLALALAAAIVVFLKQRAAHALAAAGDDEAVAEQQGPARIDPKSVPIYLPLDPFIVNLADKRGRPLRADRHHVRGRQ